MIAGIFLAAGQGSRFGKNKLLYEVDGQALVVRALRTCLDSSLPEVYVVTPPNSPRLENAIQRTPDARHKVTIVHNRHSQRGQMSSVKAGLRSLKSHYEGAMIVLADMPCVTAEIIDGLASAFDAKRGVVVPECDGEIFHPRIIPKRLFSEFLMLADDERGTAIIERFKDDVVRVRIGERKNYVDIDTASDLERLS